MVSPQILLQRTHAMGLGLVGMVARWSTHREDACNMLQRATCTRWVAASKNWPHTQHNNSKCRSPQSLAKQLAIAALSLQIRGGTWTTAFCMLLHVTESTFAASSCTVTLWPFVAGLPRAFNSRSLLGWNGKAVKRWKCETVKLWNGKGETVKLLRLLRVRPAPRVDSVYQQWLWL